MIKNKIKTFQFILLLVIAWSSCKSSKLDQAAVLKTAKDAYIYALPIVFTDFTRQAANVPNNVFQFSHKFPDHTSRLVVRPNNDTNYSSAFLDLGDEPVVITVPDTHDRYYVLPFMDAWTNVFASYGKRTTGTKPQKYLVTGPKWQGKVPEGLTELKSPTDLVWVIGRIQVNSPEDQQNFVSKIQDQFKIASLSKWQKGDTSVTTAITRYKTPLAGIEEVRQHKKTVVEAIKQIPIDAFFNYLNELLVKNPALPQDSTVIKQFAKIGIKAGHQFNLNDFDAETQKALQELPTKLFAAFDDPKTGGKNKLASTAKIGHYDNDYTLRALIAYRGLGALAPEDATYQSYTVDQNKEVLNGKNNRYVIHFEKGKTPPARAFWSITLYDKEGYLSENSIRRYAIGDRNPLKFNADGSLDIYIQHENPGSDKSENWLPAPNDEFNLSVRIYWPTEEFLKNDKSWIKPDIKKI